MGKIDKRTKAYKESQKKLQQAIDNKDAYIEKGLGDAVEKITEATGIKKVVKKLTKDCGCNERKAKLNKIKAFKTRYDIIRCFTEEQYNAWSEFRKSKGNLTNEQIKLIHEVYEQLFVRTFKRQSCCYEGFINDINQVYENY